MAKKYYAVKKGRKPGVYFTWDICKKMVDGFPGAVYKSFPTLEEAEAFAKVGRDKDIDINGESDKEKTADLNELKKNKSESTGGAYAFVDGSYNIATKVYGFGGFLMEGTHKYVLQGSGDDEEMASMRNVSGEVLGSMAAVSKAIELGITELDIYYDYMGIEMWATGAWKRNKKGTVMYHDFMSDAMTKIKINFVKVKGHSGVDGNEEADTLAKQSVGLL